MLFLKRGLGICLMLLFLLMPTGSLAEDSSSIVQKKELSVGRVTLESKEYPLDHYKMEADIGDGLKDTGDNALHAINQGMWGLNKTIASFTLYSINQLMSFDLISTIASEAGIMSERIYEIMSGTFLSLFVVLVGGVAAWRYFVNQQVGYAVKAIIGALAIMVLTFWFYSNTTGNIKWLNDRGAELEGIASSANVLISSDEFDSNAAYNPKEGIAVLENQLFNLMVKRPYLLLNYGTTKETEVNIDNPNRVDNLLQIKPYSEEGKEERKRIVSKEVSNFDNKQMSPDFSGERFGYLIITIISTIALSIPVLLLGIFKFLLQVWFLALVIFTAIPLVLSLIPSYSESAFNHGKKLVGVLMMKAGLVLLIAVITGIVTLLYESVKVTNGVEGYAFVVFLICITIWGLFKYRTEIFEVVSTGMVQGQHVVERVTTNSFNKMGDAGETGFKSVKRMVGKAYRNHQSKKRHDELLSGSAGRKTYTNGAIANDERSEYRKAVGENVLQKQESFNNQMQQKTNKDSKNTSTISVAGTSTKRTAGIDQKKPALYRKQTGRIESQNEVAASREPDKYLTRWEADQQIKNRKANPSTQTVKRSKSRKPKQRK
ncbi:CD3337/EF1877 family mobilome membrane protein [Gottfriedia sp. NPDC057948]|uniref:CD3337/EF1877 family mobilome membrane protein n=1 Tax=Gottfriedia sp. NPDC057948 TaxID=3346287 RepID=UPI0036DEE550